MLEDKQKYLRDLISKIKRLTPKEKHHILSIFKKYNVEFTKNSNGYFFNLNQIDDDILDKVSKCVDLIEQKRELITTLDQKRDAHLEYYKNLIENKLNETINKKREQYINKLILIPSETYIKKKIIKRVSMFHNLDPDILMKEYNRPKKYNKNSPYYRIHQRIQELSRKSHRHARSSANDTEGGGIEDTFNYDNDNEDGGVGDIEDSGDIDGLEGLEDELAESIGEHYVDGSQDDEMSTSDVSDYGGDASENIDDDEYYKDSNSDNETTTEHKTDKSEGRSKTTKTKHKTKKKKNIEASSNEIDYYKSLLKQSGFKFDDDKCVQIKMEEYIT